MAEQISNPWGEHAVEASKTLVFQVGPTRLNLYRRVNDLLVVEKRDGAKAVVQPAVQNEQELWESGYRRYAFDKPIERVHLRPLPPSRPVVVRPRDPLNIAPGAKVTFYVSFPLDIQLSAVLQDQPIVLERTSSVVLSDTWFGDTTQGHLAYSIKSRAQRDRSSYDKVDHGRGIVSLQISNTSNVPLRCEKFSLRLAHCALYAGDDHIWASSITVHYRGPDELSALDYAPEAPGYLKSGKLVSEAEEMPPMGLIRRTFGRANPALGGFF